MHFNHGNRCRLSSLPDPIIVDSLSLLPLKVAVSTSVLTRRWRRLWTHITDFKFRYSPIYRPTVDISGFFANVDNIRRQLSSPYIRNFTIFVNTCSMFRHEVDDCESRREYWFGCRSKVESLISRLCDRVVESMDISLYCKFLRPLIPPCVFRNALLVALDLRYRFDYKLPEEIILPCLKKLHIQLDYHHHQLIQRLIPSCPLFEDLELMVNYYFLYDYMREGILMENDVVVVISSPKLKRLKLGFSAKLARVMIEAPNLKYFEIYDYDPSMYCFAKNPTSLEHVNVHLLCKDIPMYKSHILVLVSVITSARSLRLTCAVAKLFNYVGGGISAMFCNLIKLDIKLKRIEGWKALFDFIQSLPKLEYLHVCDYKYNNDKCLEEEAWWPLDCVALHLKIIEIWGYVASKNVLKLMKYILRNATVLELLQANFYSFIKKMETPICKELEFCEELFKCSRSSPACKIRFSGKHIKASEEGIVNLRN